MKRVFLCNEYIIVICHKDDYNINNVEYWETIITIINKTESDMRLEFPATDDFNGCLEPDDIHLPSAKKVKLSWGHVKSNWFQALEDGTFNIFKSEPQGDVLVHSGGFQNLCVDGKYTVARKQKTPGKIVFTAVFEISGGVSIEADTEEEARLIFEGMANRDLLNDMNPATLVEVRKAD